VTRPGVSTLHLLAIAGFTSVLSMRLCDAMLPALATEFGSSSERAAAVVSAFALAYGVMQLAYGVLGDRHGKPRVIAFASAWCALATLAAAFAPTLHSLVLARAAMGAGAAAIVPLTLAWIGDTVALEQRQATLARFSGYTLTGMMLGAWAGGFATDMLGWRTAFYVVAPMFALSAVLLLRRAGTTSPPARSHGTVPYGQRVRELLAARWTRFVLACVFVEGALSFGFLAFVPTVLYDRFGMPLTQAGGILAVFALGGLAFSRSAALVLRRFDPPAQARLAAFPLAAGFAMLAAMPHWSWAVAACALAGYGFYALHNTLQLTGTQLSTSSRGLAMSLFAGALFVGQAVGVVLAAMLFSRLGPAWTFGLAGTGLALLPLLFGARLRQRAVSSLRAP
jgi:predicted MFS family arabinose efflux permease